VSGSASGIQVAIAGVMGCDSGERRFEQQRASGCRMWPIFGSQIGNVCARINRHEAENARVSRERASDPLDSECGAGRCEVSREA
jgi:hypothetical protein